MKLNGCLREVSKVFQGCFQDILRVFQGRLWGETFKGVSRYLKEVQRVFQGGFRDVLRKFQGCLKKVSSVFQENFIKSFKGVSSFVLQFCCSMNLIAATRAEGGLVLF